MQEVQHYLGQIREVCFYQPKKNGDLVVCIDEMYFMCWYFETSIYIYSHECASWEKAVIA